MNLNTVKEIKQKIPKKALQIALPIAILLFGIIVTLALIKSKKPPRSKKMPKEKTTLVRTIKVNRQNQPIQIHSTSTTQPSNVLLLSSEIKGKIIWVSSQFVEGGRIQKDEPVFRINPADYELMVDQARSTLVKAENDLIIAEGKQNASIKERALFKSNNSDFKMPRVNQWDNEVKKAKSTLEAAKANYKVSELNLQRTTVYAPFQGYFSTIKTSIGQFINSGQSVGELVKDQPIVLKVLLPLSDMNWIKIGDSISDESNQGSPVVITKKIGNSVHKWNGTVERQLREMDNMGKMATVIIEIHEISSDKNLLLPFGLFVDVTIKGNILKNIFSIPHEALRPNSTIWTVSKQNRLSMQPVSIIRKNRQNYFISEGLNNNDQVITSNIQAAIPGLKLGIFGAPSAKSSKQYKNKNRAGNQKEGKPDNLKKERPDKEAKNKH